MGPFFFDLGEGLWRIEDSTWQDIPNLEFLNLAYNNLSSIPDLSNLARLTTLYLQGNVIREIAAFTFSGLSQLKLVDFKYNDELGIVHQDSFAGLTNPELELRLHTAELPNSTFTMSMLVSEILPEALAVYYHRGTSLPTLAEAKWYKFPNLKDVSFIWTYQDGLPSTMFEGASHLETVRLGRNLMQYIDVEVFSSLPKLTLLEVKNPWPTHGGFKVNSGRF